MQNEMILEGGTEMNYSILHTCMFNQILEGPNQWKEMTIKSIHEKRSELLMENVEVHHYLSANDAV